MAKVTPKFPLTKIKGSFYHEVLANLRASKCKALITYNRYGMVLGKKTKPANHRTEKQTEIRDRFRQLECMWQMMTPYQRKLYTDYNITQNAIYGDNLRPMDRFRKEGLQWKLDTFLIEYCNADYKLTLVDVDEQYYYILVDLGVNPLEFFELLAQRGIR